MDGEVAIALRNEGEAAIGVPREHHVERWDDASWERLDWPESYGWTDDLPLVEPDDELELSTWPPDEGSFEEPGWYRATITVPVQGAPQETADDEGRLVLNAPFLVSE